MLTFKEVTERSDAIRDWHEAVGAVRTAKQITDVVVYWGRCNLNLESEEAKYLTQKLVALRIDKVREMEHKLSTLNVSAPTTEVPNEID